MSYQPRGLTEGDCDEMIGNYFKIAIRNFMRSKTVSLFSLLGLAAGMACCILSSIYVLDELSYDQHYDQIAATVFSE